MYGRGRPTASPPQCNDESRLLLGNDNEAQVTSLNEYTPLPKVQLSVLCYLRLLDPLNFSQIFPYINQFITTLHLTDDPSRVGFYSGLVESTFAVFQLLAIYPWAALSDRIGRRPVVLAGVAALTLTTIMFGLSQSFVAVIISRALAGLSTGNVSVLPVILCEITDATNQSTAFPFMGIFFPLGAILGSLIGGSFSDASAFPFLSPYADFFRVFPCFLPCFIVALVNFVGLIATYFFLRETLQQSPHPASKIKKKFTFKELLSIPIMRALCTSGWCLGFLSTAFDVVFVLFCYSPINTGGLGLTVSQIGYALAISSATSAVLQMFFMPIVLKRYNHFKLYDFFMAWWPYVFLGFPVLNGIARSVSSEVAGNPSVASSPLLWILMAIVLAMSKIACLAYAVNALLAKKSSPGPDALGATMGLLQLSTCIPRALSPAFVSSLFALSVEKRIIWGNLWVLTMTSFGVLGVFFSKKVLAESKKLVKECPK